MAEGCFDGAYTNTCTGRSKGLMKYDKALVQQQSYIYNGLSAVRLTVVVIIDTAVSVWRTEYRGNYCKDDNVDFFFFTLKCKITF